MMSVTALRMLVIAGLLALVLSACSQQAQPAAAAAAPAMSAEAARDLDAYRQLVAARSYEIATTMGREVLRKYPGTPAAAEVQKTLAEVVGKAKAGQEQKRLMALWDYQTSSAASGRQSTASMYSKVPAAEADRVRLIFRRHSAWGESVYLFYRAPGFSCGKPCTLTVRFDENTPLTLKGKLPETGEPAMFIEDEKVFLDQLARAKSLTVDATLKDKGASHIVFEVGGYEPAKWGPVPKS